MTTNNVKLTIRIPQKLKEQLEQLSFNAPVSSLNAKVVFILEQYCKQEENIKYPGGVSEREYPGNKDDLWTDLDESKGLEND